MLLVLLIFLSSLFHPSKNRHWLLLQYKYKKKKYLLGGFLLLGGLLLCLIRARRPRLVGRLCGRPSGRPRQSTIISWTLELCIIARGLRSRIIHVSVEVELSVTGDIRRHKEAVELYYHHLASRVERQPSTSSDE